jgi:hypothetical protein
VKLNKFKQLHAAGETRLGTIVDTSEPQLLTMNPNEQLPRRKRGHPKGSKNKPDAGTTGRPVGRPRKATTPLTDGRSHSSDLRLRADSEGEYLQVACESCETR